MTLRREVCIAAAGASTEEEFFARLAQAGVLVRRRQSTVNPGQVTGYAVGLPHHTAKGGQVIWYGGGKLTADLTLPKLRTRWADEPGRDPLAAVSALPAPAARAVLRATVATAGERAGSEAEFFTQLRAAGVLVRERLSTISPGEVTGYAVALPGCTGSDGTPRWYSGGRLHDSLTLPKLRSAWAQDRPQVLGRSGAFRFTAPERAEIYMHAASQAAVARSTCVIAPRMIPGPAQMLRGRPLTHCTPRRRRPAAGSCGARPTVTTGPHVPRTARYPAGLTTATDCGPLDGCSP